MKKMSKKILSVVCFGLLFACLFLCVGCISTTSSSSSSILYREIKCMVLGEEYQIIRRQDGAAISTWMKPEMENYTFDGWFYDAEFTQEVKKDDIITADTTIYARMLRENVYTCISLDDLWLTTTEVCLDGKRPWQYAKSKFIDGYELVGVYFDEDCTQPYDGEPANGQDVTLYFKHSIITYTITYDMPTDNPKSYTVNDAFPLNEPQHGEFKKLFGGWKTEGGRVWTQIPKGTTGNLNLKVHWVDYKRVDDEFFCGYYPQTIMPEDVTIVDGMGAYGIGSDGYYYLSKYSPVSASGKFSDGREIQPDTKYYFRMEPIAWNIFKEEDSGYLRLVSKYVLDGQPLGSASYNTSSIRTWLTDTFEIYFTGEQYSGIGISKIETGVAWLKFETENRIHLGPICWSLTSLLENHGGMGKIATDYARISGIPLSGAVEQDGVYNCYAPWWLMKTNNASSEPYFVTSSGSIYSRDELGYYSASTTLGIVPFMAFLPK